MLVQLKGRDAMASARYKTGASARTGAGLIVDSKAEAIAELILEVAQCFFRIRAVGQKTGLITGWGGGAFGFMRSLAVIGPLTVPQIAQMRPTSRQRMQRLADELAAEGLVYFIGNPKHLFEAGAAYAKGREALQRVERTLSCDRIHLGRRSQRRRHPPNQADRAASER